MTSEISITVGGDFFPREHVERAVLQRARPAEVMDAAAPLFRSADLAIANLEIPLTRATTAIRKSGPNLKADPRIAAILRKSGIGLVSLANNHTLDFGHQGLADTLAACAREGVAVVGAGLTLEDARRPYTATIKGRRVAVLGLCENESSVARHGGPGAYGLDPVDNYYAIREARKAAELVIVVLHGGSEYSHYPRPGLVRTCRFFADVGASAVVCHHPHYVQGYEIYHGVPILYSLGTLFSASLKTPDYLEVPVARLNFPPEGGEASVAFTFFRVSQEKLELVALGAEEQKVAQQRLRTYSEALQSPDVLSAKWDELCMSKRMVYLGLLLTIPYPLLRWARRLRLGCMVRAYARWRRRELMNLQNVIRCESHREAVLCLLGREDGV